MQRHKKKHHPTNTGENVQKPLNTCQVMTMLRSDEESGNDMEQLNLGYQDGENVLFNVDCEVDNGYVRSSVNVGYDLNSEKSLPLATILQNPLPLPSPIESPVPSETGDNDEVKKRRKTPESKRRITRSNKRPRKQSYANGERCQCETDCLRTTDPACLNVSSNIFCNMNICQAVTCTNRIPDEQSIRLIKKNTAHCGQGLFSMTRLTSGTIQGHSIPKHSYIVGIFWKIWLIFLKKLFYDSNTV